MTGVGICVGVWVQRPFAMLGVEYVNFAHPDEKVCQGDVVRDVIILVPGNNGACNEVPVD